MTENSDRTILNTLIGKVYKSNHNIFNTSLYRLSFLEVLLTGMVTKQCTDNGTWFKRTDLNITWTNLTQCGNSINFADFTAMQEANETVQIYNTWAPLIKNSAYVGYSISLLSLVIALVILITLKKLHCERNKLHIHLFISYIMRACMYFLKELLFVHGLAMSNDVTYEDGKTKITYTWICKAFITVQWYVILSNFIFMLMEGLYLHNLIFLNLFSESHGTTVYCIIGWIASIFFLIPWIILRLIFEDSLCWNNKDTRYISLLIEIPIGTTVVVNFILFTIIVRILILKIHFTSTFIQHQKIKYRKLLKSTLVLIPLYGIPYTISLMLGIYVNKDRYLEMFWLFFDQTFTSFQGFFAALVYCLLNSDVQSEIRRKYGTLLEQSDTKFRRTRTISTNTQQFSLQTNDDTLENLNLFGIVDDDTLKKNLNSSKL
ncbi:parathyroid hormone/parathyroid hormone-related peptide receptor-like isoform X2 [Anthonomus grandis grandis]|uniref:parathyroid hormone/parathyroid hormone-related peptide receptor-like isoform X2 n=1 Tax=Anthonomus grandis grandis TaxID=2921223 RepID=UPI0021665FDD|nr:parathyroid hormone/parathyroid hormone-related peptide receptor-like isoform X2 [Anthonomus grandis grandis]